MQIPRIQVWVLNMFPNCPHWTSHTGSLPESLKYLQLVKTLPQMFGCDLEYTRQWHHKGHQARARRGACHTHHNPRSLAFVAICSAPVLCLHTDCYHSSALSRTARWSGFGVEAALQTLQDLFLAQPAHTSTALLSTHVLHICTCLHPRQTNTANLTWEEVILL
jgi:hypothetical protein